MATTALPLAQLAERLAAEGAIPDERRAAVAARGAELARAPRAPWFLQALSLVGAWMAALALLVAVCVGVYLVVGTSASGVDAFSAALLAIGGALLVGALVLRHGAAPGAVFTPSLALALCLLGQLLVVGATWQLSRGIVAPAWLAIALGAALTATYPDRALRLLGALQIVGALVVLIGEAGRPELLHALAWALGLASTLLWAAEGRIAAAGREALLRPIAYALPAALLALLALSWAPERAAVDQRITAAGLLALLALAAALLLRHHGALRRPRALLALLAGAAALLPTLPEPGIAGALLALLLGTWRGSRPLSGLALLALAAALVSFYYRMDLTLLWKSAALAGGGLACLALRLALTRWAWPAEVTR